MSKKSFSITFFAVFGFFILFNQNTFCQTASASAANKRTAIRYMQLAKQKLAEKQWADADFNASLGLAYDDSIADLWYIRAAAKMNKGDKKSEVLPLVSKSLDGTQWSDYNKDGARILYADILCSAHKYAEAISVLDESPFIYSSDAEYIRAKSYYNQKTKESIEAARMKIDAARRVYPKDSRFADLFYRFEFALAEEKSQNPDSAFGSSNFDNSSGSDSSALPGENASLQSDSISFGSENFAFDERVQKIADAFLASLSNYKNSNPEIELLAAFFVQDSEKRTRIIKSFNAKGAKSPIYPSLALNSGLIKERDALDYFYNFADDSVFLPVLQLFIKSLKNEDSKKEFSEYLNSYNGTVLIDTDGDLLVNMTVKYERGRPSKIFYDENQDDDYEWTCDCDFGVPVVLNLLQSGTKISYGNWPYIQQAVYALPSDSKKSENSNLYDPESPKNSDSSEIAFDIISDTLAWCPFSVESEKTAKENLDFDFFVPVLNSKNAEIDTESFINSAFGYTMPSKERQNAEISVSLLNGLAQQAVYSADGKVYAQAKFENGLPVSRTVDVDGDGTFETVEEYGYSKDFSQKFISPADEMQIITNLFGSPAEKTGIYVKSIKIDRNGDTIPDFMEEYTAGEGKISSWDYDADGKWDVRYVKLPSADGEKLREEAMFHEPLKNQIVTVSSENGIPVSVKVGGDELSVKKGAAENFYWISETGLKSTEEKIAQKINQIGSQGVCIILEDNQERYLAVRVGDKIFAEILPSSMEN